MRKPSSATSKSTEAMSTGARAVLIAWLITAAYYFFQYTLRSAPAVMMPQLSDAFGLTAAGVASLAGLFYYGYSPFSLVAGVAMDRLGPRLVVPIGAAAVGPNRPCTCSMAPKIATMHTSGMYGSMIIISRMAR